MKRPLPKSPLFPYTTLFRSWEQSMTLNFVRVRQVTHAVLPGMIERGFGRVINITGKSEPEALIAATPTKAAVHAWSKGDRKSTRLNSSHGYISYAVFCLKKK